METVGKLFLHERIKRNLTLDQLEKELRIRKKYLEKIEKDEWDFSSKIYIAGIIKNYARYLNLNEKRILAIFRREYDRKEEINFKRKIDYHLITSESGRLMRFFLILFIGFFIFYFTYQFLNYYLPPQIKIISPKTKNFINEEKIKIIGQTKPESQIFISGNEVFPDKNGIFSYELPLVKGKNKLTIEVIGPNGRKTIFEDVYYRR